MAGPNGLAEFDFKVSNDFARMYLTPVSKRSLPTTPVDPNAPITDQIIHTKGGDILAHNTHGRVDEEAFWAVEDDLVRLTGITQHIP